ncbi:hypothetical protein, partial [Sulfuricurvum sp.]|uniref:hypothetical protein n=1 Tax=Sulfuricurvum sp. TaxID=2025608 RepID=UPI00262F00EA
MKKLFLLVLFFYSISLYAACSGLNRTACDLDSSCLWKTGGGPPRCEDAPNTAPTNISLSSTSVAENSASGTAVGTFTTTDTAGNTHTYTLVAGTGSTDNTSFTISGNQLKTNAIFNYEIDN